MKLIPSVSSMAAPQPIPNSFVALTRKRKQYIADLANDEWVDRVPRRRRVK